MMVYENTHDMYYHEIVGMCFITVSDLYDELDDDEKFGKILDYIEPLLPKYISVAKFSTVLEIELRTAIAERDEVDELDFFTELLNDFKLDDLKYDPTKYEYAKEFAEDHGLI